MVLYILALCILCYVGYKVIAHTDECREEITITEDEYKWYFEGV